MGLSVIVLFIIAAFTVWGVFRLISWLFELEIEDAIKKLQRWESERKRDQEINQLVASLTYRAGSIHEPTFIMLEKRELKLLLDHLREVQSA